MNQIQASGKGRALFTSKDMPGLVPDLLVAHGKALADPAKRKVFVAMARAWYDTVAFITANPKEAAVIMAKVVGLMPEDYATYLPGTRFFGAAENLVALGSRSGPSHWSPWGRPSPPF